LNACSTLDYIGGHLTKGINLTCAIQEMLELGVPALILV